MTDARILSHAVSSISSHVAGWIRFWQL